MSDTDESEFQDEDDRDTALVRGLFERQLIACRTLSAQLTDAATDVTAALVESPAAVINALWEGTTLPSALGLTGDALADAAIEGGGRVRAAVGSYVNAQSALPDALIVSTAELAGSAIRAQGAIVASALDAAFLVASTAARGDAVREVFDEEWRGVLATVSTVRGHVDDTFSAARHRVRNALPPAVAAG